MHGIIKIKDQIKLIITGGLNRIVSKDLNNMNGRIQHCINKRWQIDLRE